MGGWVSTLIFLTSIIILLFIQKSRAQEWTKNYLGKTYSWTKGLNISDGDHDQQLELFAASGWRLYRFKYDHANNHWNTVDEEDAYFYWTNFINAFAFENLDEDEYKELYLAADDGKVNRFPWLASDEHYRRWASTVASPGEPIKNFILGDIDNDGKTEGCYLYYRGQGFGSKYNWALQLCLNDGDPPLGRLLFETNMPGGYRSPPLLLDDLDHNGENEIYIAFHIPADTLSDGVHMLRIYAIDHTGLSAWNVRNVYVENNNPPAPSRQLRALSGDNKIMLSWNISDERDLAGYDLYRSRVSGSGYIKLNKERVAPLTDNFIDTTVTNGTPFYYVMKAVDQSGLESVFSDEVNTVPGSDHEPPRAAILTDPKPPVDAGKVSVFLSTSEALAQPPDLYLNISDASATISVPLKGSADTWMGEIEISKEMSSGIATFAFSGKDLSGNTGSEITIGDSLWIAITRVEQSSVSQHPEAFTLHQNYPNPFNASTTIRFELPKTSHVELSIFNTLGKEVITLVNKDYQAGTHTINWDGTDDTGKAVSSGVYVYQIRAANFTKVRKMILLR